MENLRSRLRTNLEFSGTPPFWEDGLYGSPVAGRSFTIGQVTVQGMNPCQRCVVPTRDPSTGMVTPQFQKTFVTQRKASLPNWADRQAFNHYYRLAVNTRIPASEGGKRLKVGDVCEE